MNGRGAASTREQSPCAHVPQPPWCTATEHLAPPSVHLRSVLSPSPRRTPLHAWRMCGRHRGGHREGLSYGNALSRRAKESKVTTSRIHHHLHWIVSLSPLSLQPPPRCCCSRQGLPSPRRRLLLLLLLLRRRRLHHHRRHRRRVLRPIRTHTLLLVVLTKAYVESSAERRRVGERSEWREQRGVSVV